MEHQPIELYYQDYGSGPPLIILHGLLGSSGNWHTLSRTAFAPHFHVFTVDQRSHGRSPHAEPLSYAAMAADVRDFMEQRGLASAHVLGHSMGGKTAMQMALSYPEHVRRLVVVDMAPKAYPPHHAPIFEALGGLDLARYDDRRAIDAALAEKIPSTPVRQFLMKNLAYDGAGGYTWQMDLEAIHRSYDRIIEGLEADAAFDGPALFVRGGASDYVADADLPQIRKYFPRTELLTINGAGHWVHAEQPEALAEAVLAFLRA